MAFSLPYNIVNGQAIDATPVMANFNALAGRVPASGARAAAAGANSDITSLTALSTPLSVAQGGTGDTGTAWATATLTVGSTAGTIGAATASVRYKFIGKTVFYVISISITSTGTAAGSLVVSGLPWTFTGATAAAAGRENSVTGVTVLGSGPSGATYMTVYTYSNGYPGGNGYNLSLSGVAERV
jgi:hypothetical protein